MKEGDYTSAQRRNDNMVIEKELSVTWNYFFFCAETENSVSIITD